MQQTVEHAAIVDEPRGAIVGIDHHDAACAMLTNHGHDLSQRGVCLHDRQSLLATHWRPLPRYVP
ncbi:MAG TPA: hypothetical protein VK891_01125, partial [Euzebyales bacterium]|nr:hypothetical protein [Euzebyales bacterium]